MKTLIIALLCSLGFAVAAHAEDFTMTRGYDNKTFYCTDRTGTNPIGVVPSVTVCDCAYGSNNYGQVLATAADLGSLRTSCQVKYGAATIKDCQTLAAPQGTVTCDCTYGSNNYGQVIAGIANLGDLTRSCSQSYGAATIRNCAVR